MDYIALGCMTGTSLDGIDCSLVKTDGTTYVTEILCPFGAFISAIFEKIRQVYRARFYWRTLLF